MLTRRIIKQRNQYVINLPSQFCTAFGWKKGDNLIFTFVTKGVIQIEKLDEEEIMKLKGRGIPAETGES